MPRTKKAVEIKATPFDQMGDTDFEILYFIGEINNLYAIAESPTANHAGLTHDWDICWAHLLSLVPIKKIEARKARLDWENPAPERELLAWKGQTGYPPEGYEEHTDILLQRFYQKLYSLRHGLSL